MSIHNIKKTLVILLISLLVPIRSFSQGISTDSTFTLTPEQLKLTNLIFEEHRTLSLKVPLLEKKITTLEESNRNFQMIDSLRVIQMSQCEDRVSKLKKTIKVKNVLITGLGTGLLVSLLTILWK